MKGAASVLRASSPLLALGGLALAQQAANLTSNVVETVADPVQGGFRTFMTISLDGQPIRALLDTGSSDLTVQRLGSRICEHPAQQCDARSRTGAVFGALDLDAAAHARPLNVSLSTSFTGGAAFEGQFVEVPFRAGDGAAVSLQTGVIDSGNPPPGGTLIPVFGVGPVQGESTFQKGGKDYPNLPARLKEAGAIKANAFGLYLGDFRSPENGSIVWGGYDAAKFDGELQTVPLERDRAGNLPSFVVQFSSLRVTKMKDGGEGGGGAGEQPSGGTEDGDAAPGRDSGDPGAKSGRSGGSENGRPGGSEDGRPGGNEDGRLRGSEDGRPRSSEDGPLRGSEDGRPARRHVAPKMPARRPARRRQHDYRRARAPPSARELQRRQQDGNLLTRPDQVVLVDTGDPELVLPADTVEAIARALGGGPAGAARGLRVDCGRIRGMALAVGMGDDRARIEIPLEPMVLGPEFEKDLPPVLTQQPEGGPDGGPDGSPDGGEGAQPSGGNDAQRPGEDQDSLGNGAQRPGEDQRTRVSDAQRPDGDQGSQPSRGSDAQCPGDDSSRDGASRGVSYRHGPRRRDRRAGLPQRAAAGLGAETGPGGETETGQAAEAEPAPAGEAPGGDGGAAGGCLLPITPVEGDGQLSVFGSPAMQAMYVVFDMDAATLSFAQARLNETGSDLREVVPSGGGEAAGREVGSKDFRFEPRLG